MLKFYQVLAICTLLVLINSSSKRPDAASIQAIKNVYDKPWYSGYLDITDPNM